MTSAGDSGGGGSLVPARVHLCDLASRRTLCGLAVVPSGERAIGLSDYHASSRLALRTAEAYCADCLGSEQRFAYDAGRAHGQALRERDEARAVAAELALMLGEKVALAMLTQAEATRFRQHVETIAGWGPHAELDEALRRGTP